METQTMGSVIVTAKIESLEDLYKVRQGILPSDQARRVEVTDALVDTGASILSMPKRLITQLGLQPIRSRQARHQRRSRHSPGLRHGSADDPGPRLPHRRE